MAGKSRKEPNKNVKISVNLPVTQLDQLREYAAENGITVTEALRRAIRVHEVLYDETKKNRRIIIQGDGERAKELIMV